jgi:thiamine-phosphate pyrophosphorylase
MQPVVCMITDLQRYGADWERTLVDRIGSAARGGAHLIQIREKDLEARVLARLVRAALDAVRGTGARVLVNDRVDVALACATHGAHLPAGSAPAARVRALAGPGFIIGRSVHGIDEVGAELGPLDYVLFGTVFPTASKPGREAAGVEALGRVVAATALPVLAVGGVTWERWPQVRASGAAGFAAIGLFA